MSDPYASGMFKENPYASKVDVVGKLAVVLRGKYENRGLKLIKPISRVLNTGEVHELIVTDQAARPGDTVDPIAYIGFFAVSAPGVIVAGDELWIGNQKIGLLAGFDETHMPNHLNIVIQNHRKDGVERGLKINEQVVFKQ